jgi:hypothetical protein
MTNSLRVLREWAKQRYLQQRRGSHHVSESTVIEAFQKKAFSARKSRNRRIFRRLTQCNLKFLFLLLTATGVLCVTGPFMYRHVRMRVDQTLLPFRLRQEVMARLRKNRPIATAYRKERLVKPEDRGVWAMQGECRIGGQWYRYLLYDGARGPVGLIPVTHRQFTLENLLIFVALCACATFILKLWTTDHPRLRRIRRRAVEMRPSAGDADGDVDAPAPPSSPIGPETGT